MKQFHINKKLLIFLLGFCLIWFIFKLPTTTSENQIESSTIDVRLPEGGIIDLTEEQESIVKQKLAQLQLERVLYYEEPQSSLHAHCYRIFADPGLYVITWEKNGQILGYAQAGSQKFKQKNPEILWNDLTELPE